MFLSNESLAAIIALGADPNKVAEALRLIERDMQAIAPVSPKEVRRERNRRYQDGLRRNKTEDVLQDDDKTATPLPPSSPPVPPLSPTHTLGDIYAGEGHFSESQKPKSRKALPAFLIPLDWIPPPAQRRYALENGMTNQDIDRESLNFRDCFIDKQDRRPGWDRSWQRWVRTWASGNRKSPRLAGAPRPSANGSGVTDFASIAARRRAERGD